MNQWKVYGILTFVMLMWGFNLPSVKYMVRFVDPVTLTSFRILTAGISVFTLLAVFKLLRWPEKNEWKYIFLASLLNVVGHHYFLSSGLALTSGTNAGLVLGTGPMLTAVLVSLIMRNYPSKLQWFGVVVGMIGVSATVLVGNGGANGMNIGDVFVFLSILSQVFSYLIIAKMAHTLDPRLLTGYMFVIGSVVLFIISLIQEPGEIRAFAEVPPNFWLAFCFSAMLGTAVGHMLYNYSIGQAGPTKAAIFMNFNTFFSLVGASVILGEEITTRHLFGLILIVIGVIFGSGAADDIIRKRKKRLST
ncbi:DMT family transporter [Planomicrobium sp. CPCC 101110]|uniref:DMT family transporter n=1 Tax=Planomicrobium sp. CPCC 101110 TaxID=2599619 RepID=UPI0011B7FEB3|nr:DMT family transporter [Planomicrobium sp. CPCC 101110]TWT27683.1 DMT family transporter [Planomicrobium sp. CPCC 101110]